MEDSPPGIASTASYSPSRSPSPWAPPSPSTKDACITTVGGPADGGTSTGGAFKTALGYASRLSRNPHKGPVGGPEEREDAASFASKSALLVQGLQQHIQLQLQQQQRKARGEGDGVVVHTGAGISTSAGIPDFRGPSGVWTLEKNGQTLADVEANIVQVSFGKQKRPVVPFHLALPTATHLILQALTQPRSLLLPEHQKQQDVTVECKKEDEQQHQRQEAGLLKASASSIGAVRKCVTSENLHLGPKLRLIDYIITQNVDALHARCGAPLTRLGEVHGNMFVERCDSCARRFLREFALPTLSFRPTGRLCGLCDFPPSGVCTDVLLDWFDAYEPHFMSRALNFSRLSPFHLCLGTSLQIQPACHFPCKERKPSSAVGIVNLQKTPLDSDAFVCMHAPVDTVLQELAGRLGLSPGWGWNNSLSGCSGGSRWGSMGSCDPTGFETDTVPFHFGEFIRSTLLFVLRLPTHALPPDLHQRHQQHKKEGQQQRQQEQSQRDPEQPQPRSELQKALPCGVQGPDDPWADSIAWLGPQAACTAAASTVEKGGAKVQYPGTPQNGGSAQADPQTFLLAVACANSVELDGSSSSSSSVVIECVDSLRSVWKVSTNHDCTLRLNLWYGSSAALHLKYKQRTRGIEADVWQFVLACTPDTHASSLPPSICPPPAAAAAPQAAAPAAGGAAAEPSSPEADIWGCTSSLPSSRVSLVPPFEPRWPQGRAIRCTRLIAILTPQPCAAAVAAVSAEDIGKDKGMEFSDTKEWILPPSLVSLYRMQGLVTLPPKETLHAALLQQQRPTGPSLHASPSSSPAAAALSPFEGSSATPAPPLGAAAVCTLENTTNSSSSNSVERRYPLRSSRQTGTLTPPGPPKRRRVSASAPRGGNRGPLQIEKVPAVRLPTEEEEATLPYIPLQLSDSVGGDEQKRDVEGKAAALVRSCCCSSTTSCGAPLLLLAADWDLGSLVESVPPDIKPAKRYARLLQRASKQHQVQQTVSQRVDKVWHALLQQLCCSSNGDRAGGERACPSDVNRGAEARVYMAGAFTWKALRSLPLWTLDFLQDLLECM